MSDQIVLSVKEESYDRNEWCTPSPYIEAVRAVFGGYIDLDPASTSRANHHINARRYFTKENSALDKDWGPLGRVTATSLNAEQVGLQPPVTIFLNPPYGRGLIDAFVDKFIREWYEDKIEQAIILTNNSTETKWAQNLLRSAKAICMPDHRIQFKHPDPSLKGKASNRQAQLFFYFYSTRTQRHLDAQLKAGGLHHIDPKLIGALRIQSFCDNFCKFGFCSKI